ncbi:MAG: class I SAM-dependent methyltransferase [Gammaproteobacteria bacterium]|nr:MAG: class I SAM-dependent methyltransferase [Gammaproteobacteria bacterium]
MLVEINSCEICDNKNLFSILNLGLHPMCDDLVPLGDLRICKEYPIEILFCEKCVTAHQRFQVSKTELFPQNYHYRSRHTADVLNGMRQIVEFCDEHYGDLTDKKILDIGCNDGSLLNFFREKNAKTFGIEPTDAFKESQKAGHEVMNDFFNEDIAVKFVTKYGQPDLITFTNVFAHIENLKKVLQALKILINDKTVIIIENHYLGAIIEKFQFDTFYHEHPRTYSCTSFTHIAATLDLNLSDVIFPSRYNGNIRVVYLPRQVGEQHNSKLLGIIEKEKSFFQKFKAMAKKIDPWCKDKRANIEQLVSEHGRLSAKAFPGRAAILVKMLKLDSDLISATYEKSQSSKINHYIPGTQIPILSDDKFDFIKNTAPLLNLAWHIPTEIKSYLEERGYYGPIINIISEKDLT